MDNAGGTQTARQVGERLLDYLYNTNVQLGASYETSRLAGERISLAQMAMAAYINAPDPSTVILGPSTTQLLQNLSKSLSTYFKPGDEVIVTNVDHEANIGPWRYLERFGITVKTWEINRDTYRLELDDLAPLLTPRTRLVAFTHISNILGTINPVKKITAFVHGHGAMVCVDGVAAVPHRIPDVQEMDVDFYVFSLYKVFGPHYSLLYAGQDILEKLPGINHFFIGRDELPYKLQPGNVNYELSYSLMGIIDYFEALASHHAPQPIEDFRARMQFVYDLFAEHEEQLAATLIDFLNNHGDLRIIGEPAAERGIRVPTVSFIHTKRKSDEIVAAVDRHKIGIRYGDFYARRLIDDLGLAANNGVVRVSLVHYNTSGEVKKLTEVLYDEF